MTWSIEHIWKHTWYWLFLAMLPSLPRSSLELALDQSVEDKRGLVVEHNWNKSSWETWKEVKELTWYRGMFPARTLSSSVPDSLEMEGELRNHLHRIGCEGKSQGLWWCTLQKHYTLISTVGGFYIKIVLPPHSHKLNDQHQEYWMNISWPK